MPGRISGPFITGGGDGSDYFAILPPEPALIRAFTFLEEARKEALKHPDPAEGKARAAAISLVISQVGTSVEAAALATAKEAEAIVRDRVKKTQKRPDPPGSAAKLRLQDAIRCRALPTVIPGGAVGVGDVGVLDEVVGKDGRPYWRAQEFGSDHLVQAGKKLYGYFQPGDSPAGAAPFRTHPVFDLKKGGPPMVPKRPIPERAFLREGAYMADAFRQKELGAAVSTGTKECQAIVAGTAAVLKRVRRVVK